jgi:hypothetical protein
MLKGATNLNSITSHQLHFLLKVFNLIPKEEEGERFEDALARVCRCIGGGAAMTHEDSDSDLEVISDSISVNLRCPVSDG